MTTITTYCFAARNFDDLDWAIEHAAKQANERLAVFEHEGVERPQVAVSTTSGYADGWYHIITIVVTL